MARLTREDGSTARPGPSSVDFMIEFEQRFGGLWYSVLRDGENGMEYGLEGCPAVHHTGFGLAVRGIMDGSWTSRVDVLEDGRTLMRLGKLVPDRLINSSVLQRIESDALLAEVGRWPHYRYGLAVPSGGGPAVSTGQFPPAVPQASGPANRWWLGSDRAVLLRLSRWWTRRSGVGMTASPLDYWTMWCFVRAESDLTWASARHDDITSEVSPWQDWCVICLGSLQQFTSCRPANSDT
jgi:hypothetical protein